MKVKKEENHPITHWYGSWRGRGDRRRGVELRNQTTLPVERKRLSLVWKQTLVTIPLLFFFFFKSQLREHEHAPFTSLYRASGRLGDKSGHCSLSLFIDTCFLSPLGLWRPSGPLRSKGNHCHSPIPGSTTLRTRQVMATGLLMAGMESRRLASPSVSFSRDGRWLCITTG